MTAIFDLNMFDKVMKLDVTLFTKISKGSKLFYVAWNKYFGIINGKPKRETCFLHRYLLDAKKGEYVDHFDHDPMNNRMSNLRISSNKQNVSNRKARNSNNTTGHRNVSYYNEEYLVQLQVEGKNKVILKTKDYDEACKIADEARIKYYGEFAGESV